MKCIVYIKFGKAFTLIELLIVMALIIILSAMVIPVYNSAMSNSRGRQCSANILIFEDAKSKFIMDNAGVQLNDMSQLAPYLKYGTPTCPAGGTYTNIVGTNPDARYLRTHCSLDTGVSGLHNYGQP